MEIQESIIRWASARGIFDKATPDSQHTKTLEEVQELTDALADNNLTEIKDAIGDTGVTLTIQAHMHGWTLEECLQAAYDEIKNRKGHMVDGVFVKDAESDKSPTREERRGLANQLKQTQTVLGQIKMERGRQITKGYDAVHDNNDDPGSHARAAAFYAIAAYFQRDWYEGGNIALTEDELDDIGYQAETDSPGYPWENESKRVEPTARENLIKAAALIVAEVERIDREGFIRRLRDE